MDALLQALERYGLQIVFVGVLLDQGGLPLPSFSLVIVAAALAMSAGESLWPIFVVAVVATLIADLVWFAAGRRFGTAMLRAICRVSLSPDSCVGRTQQVYVRWGAPSLIVAKYVPGLAAVATTLAGETRTHPGKFALYDGLGAALWAAGAVALGAVFNEAVDAVLKQLELLGNSALVLVGVALAVFIAVKWWQRYRFQMRIRMARVTPNELDALRQQASVILIDARSADRRARSGWIPGSIELNDAAARKLDAEVEVVVYCDCPNDATAALVAKQLQARGIARVRPLAGGIEAWRESGRPIETA